jgi:predicted RNA-binding Zn-ribbon protein involved in translation (DUF1610 family)
MSLNQQQEKQLQNWLQSHRVHNNCPACGSSKPRVHGDIIQGTLFVKANQPETEGAVSMVQVICTDCGFIMLFNAARAGLC